MATDATYQAHAHPQTEDEDEKMEEDPGATGAWTEVPGTPNLLAQTEEGDDGAQIGGASHSAGGSVTSRLSPARERDHRFKPV